MDLLPARNAGIRIADGEFIAFLDSDDLFLPEKTRDTGWDFTRPPGTIPCAFLFIRMDATGNELAFMPWGAFTGQVYPGILFRVAQLPRRRLW